MFFIGYGVGILLFFLPDKIGRKGTMKFVLPAHIIASFISVFGNSLYLKSVGFFLQGVLHLRITISYCHCLELVMDKHKPIASTAINSLDSGSIMIMAGIFNYYNKHVNQVLQIYWAIGFFFCLVYFYAIPESPRYLFMQNPNS